MGGAGPGCTDSNLSHLSIPTILNHFDFPLHFLTAKFYPSHHKKKMESKTDYFGYIINQS